MKEEWKEGGTESQKERDGEKPKKGSFSMEREKIESREGNMEVREKETEERSKAKEDLISM